MAVSSQAKPTLRLKDLLDSGETAFGTFMMFKGVRAAQVVSHLGFDAVIVDCEHGNIGDSDMHDMVATIACAGISPIVRIRGGEAPLIKRALDTGAHGVLVPMVNTAADAQAVVKFAKFPPLGIRGQGSPFACFSFGYATPAEYVANANARVLTMVQIETPEAVSNIDAICQVEGLDVILIGPNDLALSMLGYAPAKWTESPYLDAIRKVAETAKRRGKKCGIVVVDGEAAKKMKERFDLVVLTADVRALQAWYGRELGVARG